MSLQTKTIWWTAGCQVNDVLPRHGNVSFEAQVSALISDVLWHRKSTSLRWIDELSRQCDKSTVN